MVDLVENPEIVHYCLGKLFDLAYTNTLRIYEAIPGRVDISYVAEDIGGQDDLMFSPRHIRRFLFPGMKRMIDLVHSAGAYVFHHNDGNVTRILPDLIGPGIDVLNPIQWRCQGMEREGLKRDFGGRLVFHGGVDNQYTLPFGTVAEVRQEVRDNLRILGAGGGYILAPCHNIQPITPVEKSWRCTRPPTRKVDLITTPVRLAVIGGLTLLLAAGFGLSGHWFSAISALLGLAWLAGSAVQKTAWTRARMIGSPGCPMETAGRLPWACPSFAGWRR